MLKEFEGRFINMIASLKFKQRSSLPNYQKELIKEVNMIKKEPRIIVPADKTRNYYKIDKDKYNELRNKAIHKDYIKAKTDK